jgi:hypothetical protein
VDAGVYEWKELGNSTCLCNPLDPTRQCCSYGTASLAIHVPQCQTKFLAEQEKLPKHQRRPLPQAPTALGAVAGGSTAAAAEEWNAAAFKSYTEHGYGL